MSAVIERNSALPCSKIKRFFTANDFQRRVKIDVYQGEEYYVDNNIYLGEINVDVPPALRGRESATVRYTYDINGILIVDVKVDSTKETVQQIMTTGTDAIEPEKMEQYIEALEKLKFHPANQEENQMVLAWGERLFAQPSGMMREEIAGRLQYFQHLLQVEQDTYKIRKWKKKLESYFSNIEEHLENIDIYEMKEDIDMWFQEDTDGEDELEEEYGIWYDGHLTH